jgi:hypothetical protein
MMMERSITSNGDVAEAKTTRGTDKVVRGTAVACYVLWMRIFYAAAIDLSGLRDQQGTGPLQEGFPVEDADPGHPPRLVRPRIICRDAFHRFCTSHVAENMAISVRESCSTYYNASFHVEAHESLVHCLRNQSKSRQGRQLSFATT